MEWKTDADWKASIDENIRMGFLEIMILHLLSERDMYGYEIKKFITERTMGAFVFGESSLYIPLLRMAKRGLVSSRKELVVGKRFRTYYHLEEMGQRYLKYAREQSDIVFNGIYNLFNWEGNDNEQ